MSEAAGAEVTIEGAASLLRASARPLLLTHRNPDGDAIGSVTALAAALRGLGKLPRIACPDPLSPVLLAIPEAAAVGTVLGDDWDLVVSVDVSDPQMLRPLVAAEPGWMAAHHSLNIDHHLSNMRYAKANLVAVHAASAAEIIYDLVRALGANVDRRMATQLLYGFVNDTHSFQNSNTTPRTLRVAADLLEIGADLSKVIFDLLLSRRISNAQLWSQVLPTLAFDSGQRMSSLVVSQHALASAGATMPDADGLVEFLFSIQGVQLAVLYKELGPGSFRLSMRSAEGIDATAIAGIFGGGGHRRAAGCDARLPLHEVQAEVLAAFLAQASDTSG